MEAFVKLQIVLVHDTKFGSYRKSIQYSGFVDFCRGFESAKQTHMKLDPGLALYLPCKLSPS